MSDQGKANYTAVAAKIGGQYDHYDKLSPSIRAAYDAGADAVEAWLSQAPVDEDMPGNEPDPGDDPEYVIASYRAEVDRVKTDAQVKLDAHRDEIDRLRVLLAEQSGSDPDDVVSEILLNAPERYDGDEAAESIAVRYVRDLELIAKGATTLRTACEGLERICMGTADEADSSSIAEKALFAAIGHMSVSAIGTGPEPESADGYVPEHAKVEQAARTAREHLGRIWREGDPASAKAADVALTALADAGIQ